MLLPASLQHKNCACRSLMSRRSGHTLVTPLCLVVGRGCWGVCDLSVKAMAGPKGTAVGGFQDATPHSRVS